MMKNENLVNLCDSCLNFKDFPNCYDEILFGDGIGKDNIICCNRYNPRTFLIGQKDIAVNISLEETNEFWPQRRLTKIERKMLLTKILKHTSTDLSNTLSESEREQSKTLDSRLIKKFLETNQDEKEIEYFFLLIGLEIRKFLANPINRQYLGLMPINTNFIVQKDGEDKPN